MSCMKGNTPLNIVTSNHSVSNFEACISGPDSPVDEVNLLEEFHEEAEGFIHSRTGTSHMSQTVGNNLAGHQMNNAAQITSSVGNSKLANALIGSPADNVARTPSTMHEQQPQQVIQGGQLQRQAGQLQTIITPQGLQNRKIVSASPANQEGQFPHVAQKVNSTITTPTRQIPVQHVTSGNQGAYTTQQIVLTPQQKQYIQQGNKTTTESRIRDILTQANTEQALKSRAVPSATRASVSHNTQVQGTAVNSQTAPSQLNNLLTNIISSPGSAADIKNASGGKVQFVYKSEGKELTKEQLQNLTSQVVLKPNSQAAQVIRQKILEQQQQGTSSQQRLQVNASAQQQQQSVVIQTQVPQRQIVVQQGGNVAVQQQPQISRSTTQLAQQPQSHQDTRTQQWVSYQQQRMQNAQNQRLLQGQRQVVQGQQRQIQQGQQQQVIIQQQQLGQNHQQVQFQSPQGQQRIVQGNVGNSTVQGVNSQGQLYITQGGKQYLVRSPQVSSNNVIRNVNQPVQTTQQLVYNSEGQPVNQLVRVIPQGAQGQSVLQGQLTANQGGQVVQNGPVLKYIGNTSNTAMNTTQYQQQNVQGPTTVFTSPGQKPHQGIQSNVPQQSSVLTVATQGAAQVQHSYSQAGSTVINTQPNSAANAGGQITYQTARPGLAQLRASYSQGSQAQYVQVANSMGQVQQRAVVPTMASTVVRQMKETVTSTATVRPQVHTVLATPDDDSPPSTPLRPGQLQQQQQQMHQVQQMQQHPQPGGQPATTGQAIVTLITGQNVTHCLKTLPPGTEVQVRRPDNATLPAIWNGKSISLKNQMPAAPLRKPDDNSVDQPNPSPTQVQQQVLVVPQAATSGGQQQFLMFANNQGLVQNVVGGGGGSNHPLTGTDKLTRRPLHAETQGQHQSGPVEPPKPVPKKRPLKPFEDGKYALCTNCGMQSANYVVCEGCNKEMPEEPKYHYDSTYTGAKKSKLSTDEETDAKGNKLVVTGNKGLTMDKKMFFGKAANDMQFLITDGSGKQIRKMATRSPMLPRVLARSSMAKKAKPMKKSSEPEVVSILSSDEEESGNAADSSNAAQSPSRSRSNTPTTQNASASSSAKQRKHRMEDKVKKTEDIQMPEFLECGADASKVDEHAQPKWNWSWMDVEIMIEFSGGLHQHIVGDAIRKTTRRGEAYCILCRKAINYHRRGRATILDHCRKQDHMGHVLLNWQESGMFAGDGTVATDTGTTAATPDSTTPKKNGKTKSQRATKKTIMSFTVPYTGSIGGSEMNLDVRSVRIGSLKAKPFDNCLVNKDGFVFKIQYEGDRYIEINVTAKDIEQLIAHLGEETPVLFIYATPGCAGRIRSQLNMKSDGGPYFDPGSRDESQKRLVLQMHPPSEEQLLERQFQTICKGMQKASGVPMEHKQFLTLIDRESAEKMLESVTGADEGEPGGGERIALFHTPEGTQIPLPIETLPNGDVTVMYNGQRIILTDYRGIGRPRNSDDEDDEPVDRSRSPSPLHAVFTGEIVRLFIYPPQPRTGGIQVSNEDLFCLNEGEFLNDVIIDFYLKYLNLDVLSEEDRERTHIFSSFFYRRLTQRAKRNEDQNLTPQQRRHSRVKTWTRHVDLFKKDFIIVPINESAHWYLAIICFPGLENIEYWTTPPPKQQIMLPEKTENNAEKAALEDARSEAAKSEVAAAAALKQENNMEDRDTAEDEGEKSAPNGESSQETEAKAEKEVLDEMAKEAQEERKAKSPQEGGEENMETGEAVDSEAGTTPDVPVGSYGFKKRPCILVFDSLAGPSRNAVVRTLREYLQVEWDTKKAATEGERVFDKDFIKGANPKCPQQTNFSDCGVYVLQYVESFYKMPIINYTIPMKCLERWFPDEYVLCKRERLRELILNLQKELNPTLEYDPAQDICL